MFRLGLVGFALLAATAAAQPPRDIDPLRQKSKSRPKDGAAAGPRQTEEERRRAYDALPEKAKQHLEAAKRSVAVVHGAGLGSGFVVGPGLLATNAHVIGGALVSDLRVQFVSAADPNPPRLKVALVYEDRAQDLALLQVETGDRPPLPIADPADVTRNMPVAVVGNPAEVKGIAVVNSVSLGRFLDAAAPPGGGRNFYRIDAYAEKGNSGGPVIGRHGRVVGILTFRTADEPQRENYCVPAKAISDAIGTVGPADGWPDRAKAVAAVHAAALVAGRAEGYPSAALAAVKVWQVMNDNYANGQRNWWQVRLQAEVNGRVVHRMVDGRDLTKTQGKDLQSKLDELKRLADGLQGNKQVPAKLREEIGALVTKDLTNLTSYVAGMSTSKFATNKAQIKTAVEQFDKRMEVVNLLLDERNGK